MAHDKRISNRESRRDARQENCVSEKADCEAGKIKVRGVIP
jgi:hypothetical protein